jgi:regulatory protein
VANRRRPPALRSPPSPASLRATALGLLGRRDYTTKELRQKLLARGYSSEAIGETLDALGGQGLVDDRRSAEAHVRQATRIKGRGPLRIKLELKARGVGADAIAGAMGDLSDEAVRQTLDDVLRRKRIALPVPPVDRPKLYRQLLGRGFPAHIVSAALRFRPEDD